MGMRPFLLLFSLAAGAFAQQVSFGVIGGGTATDAFHTQNVPNGSPSLPYDRFYSPSKDWVLGGMFELGFRSPLSVEVDGLYRKFHFTTAAVEPGGTLNSVSPSPVVTWQFPVLLKYRFHRSKVSEFVELGPSFRTTGNLNGTDPSHYGITGGLGAELHFGRIHIAPAVRYTRWAADHAPAYRANSNPDQVELLVGLSRGSELGARPWGERFSFGVVAGAVLRNDLPNSISSTPVPVPLPGGGYTLQKGTTKYFGRRTVLVGPRFEIAVHQALSLAIEGLYHPLRYYAESSVDGGTPLRTSTFNDAITWEFPVLAHYTFSHRTIAPFVEMGPTFRLPQSANGPLSTHGIAAGGGLRIRVGGFKIGPVLRYTHWGPDRTGAVKNQIELLAGIAY